MILRLKIAVRNIIRHRGRTVVNVLMISGAVVGQVIFAGFSDYILTETRRVMIDNQFGHIQIAEKDFWDLKPGKRTNQLIANSAQLEQALSSDPDVKWISGRLTFFGLVSTGELTVSAKGMGFDPIKEVEFGRNLLVSEGEGLGADSKMDVCIGGGLRKKINVNVGDTMTVLTYTLDGVMNAMDLRVRGIIFTGNSEIDDNLFVMPLATVQNLLDTDRVELVTVRLHDTKLTDSARERLQKKATELKPSYKAKTWHELAFFFRQVEAFFKVQNFVIQIILLTLVFLGILNTIGMSVYERTGEIGTVRSLGERPSSVVRQFLLEGFLFGALGSTFGALLGWLCSLLITWMQFGMELPGTSVRIPIVINFIPGAYLEAIFISTCAAVAATWLPALRASKMSIVEALKKNI